jgi:integrase
MMMPRILTDATARQIRDRDVRDYERVREQALAYAAEHGYTTAWRNWVCRLLKLALAVRDADGDDLVREEILDDLPRFADAVTAILRRAELFRARPSTSPSRSRARPRSCEHCESWGFETVCEACRKWRNRYPPGVCDHCRRHPLPLRHNLCRGCALHISEHGPRAPSQSSVQLWFGGELSLTLRTVSGKHGYQPTHGQSWRRERTLRGKPAPAVSAYLLDPAQLSLFGELRRDWSVIDSEHLPALTDAAERLMADFEQTGRTQAWVEGTHGQSRRALRLLLAWLGAEAPIPESDIRSISAPRSGSVTRPSLHSRRVLQFLTQRGLVVPDPVRAIDPDRKAIDQRIQTLPACIGDEVSRWVQVLRGEGRRAQPPLFYSSIRQYLGAIYPALLGWSRHIGSLREITPDHVREALRGLHGHHARHIHSALRSLFRSLKQERLIFRDPTRAISLRHVTLLPTPLASDRVAGLMDKAVTPLARFMVALVAIHALGSKELSRLKFVDLDLARGQLVVHRCDSRSVYPHEHTIYLEELTHTVAVAWLRERHHRWPLCANPHLLVSTQTAVDITGQSMSTSAVRGYFAPLGVTPKQLRQDRILDEARHSEDPLQLMQVFGIAASTAMKYLYTAHPERRSKLPR